jgi:multicomponent Na+:H+ antiporter subunit F
MVMTYLNFALALVVAFAILLMLSRLFIGPTLYDRVLAVNSFGTKTVLFLVLFSLLVGRPDGIDIALLYALINFIATIAILKFFRYGSLDVALSKMVDDEGATPTDKGSST